MIEAAFAQNGIPRFLRHLVRQNKIRRIARRGSRNRIAAKMALYKDANGCGMVFKIYTKLL